MTVAAAAHRPARTALTLAVLTEVVQHAAGDGLLVFAERGVQRLQNLSELLRLGGADVQPLGPLSQALATLLDALRQRQLFALLAVIALGLLLGATLLALRLPGLAALAALLEVGADIFLDRHPQLLLIG